VFLSTLLKGYKLVKKVQVLIGSIIIAGLGLSVYSALQTETVNVEVTGKETKLKKLNETISDVYMIYTDKTTYSLEDSILAFNFDVSDDYGKIIQGKCYEFGIRGLRIPVMSMYQNIETIKEIDCKNKDIK